MFFYKEIKTSWKYYDFQGNNHNMFFKNHNLYDFLE